MAGFRGAISSLTCLGSKKDKMKSEIQKICEVHDDDSGKENMESETRNRCEVQQDDDLGKDMISELPDELLHHILSCLPTKDIVRTSALSTRWRWLWTFFTIVSVDFGAEDEDENDSASFFDLVQNKLLIPDTARIRKFRIHLHKYSHFYTYLNILCSISLVSKALKHQVEELELSFPHLWRSNMLSLPHTLFTSESLTSLKLHMSHAASVNPYPISICFPRLKTLHLICIKFLDERFAELLFSGCLVLEELLLDNCYWNTTHGITIAIATLQRLAIYHYYSSSNNALKIRCPKLQFLKFWSCSFFNLVLHLPSLIKGHIEITRRGNLYQRIRLARATLNLLERIRGVKSLRLSSETLKTISCAENVLADDLPTFHNLTSLKLIGGDCDLSAAALLHILHKSPKLQSIVFPHGLKLDNLKEKTHSLKNAVPDSLINSLESFRVLHFRGNEEEVFFLKHILKHATALKRFSVCCSEDLSEDLERKEEIRWELKKLCSEHCAYLFW